MKLIEIFNKLEKPIDNSYYVGEDIGNENQIAKDYMGRPLFFIKTSGITKNNNPITLEKIKLEHSKKIIIQNKNNKKEYKFSFIYFTDNNSIFYEYFLDQIETLNKLIQKNITKDELENLLNTIIEIWRGITEPSKEKIIGLWGELFTIFNSNDIELAILSWHNKNNNKYDFYNNNEAVEIKSTTNNIRKHHFSQSQLNTKEETFIISLLLQDDINGYTITDLKNKILEKINNENLILNFKKIFYKTIGLYNGSKIEKLKFNLNYTRSNIKIFYSKNIPILENIHDHISDIEFVLNLSLCTEIEDLNKFKFINIFK